MADYNNIRSTGLALGGGAARGWAHIGVFLALAEHNIKATHIAGTSIGAFVGAFYAIDPPDILIQPKLSHISYLDFARGEENIQLGYKVTMETFE